MECALFLPFSIIDAYNIFLFLVCACFIYYSYMQVARRCLYWRTLAGCLDDGQPRSCYVRGILEQRLVSRPSVLVVLCSVCKFCEKCTIS